MTVLFYNLLPVGEYFARWQHKHAVFTGVGVATLGGREFLTQHKMLWIIPRREGRKDSLYCVPF